MTDAERQKTIAELQKAFNELHAEVYEKDKNLAQERGREFEKLVRGVFGAWDMLVRGSYHTGDNSSEQIDGVLQFEHRYALLEAKWVKSNLAASELFSFLGKVEGKFTGTIGVFVSRNELTPNFLTALRAGRRQSIIVIHGRDVDQLFTPSFDLCGYLSAHVMHVCTDNLCHLSADTYLTMLKAHEVRKKKMVANNAVEAKIKECLEDEATKNIVNELADDLNDTQKVDAVQRIVTNYADIASSEGGDEAWRSTNLEAFLEELVERLPSCLTVADQVYFMDKLSKDFQNPHFGPMLKWFAPRYVYLSSADRDKFEERLVRQWDKVVGDWMSENRVAEATRPLWSHLGESTRTHLIGLFVDFVLSNRGPKHPQHRLADYALDQPTSMSAATAALRKHAQKASRALIEAGYTDAPGLEKTAQSVKGALQYMRQYIPEFDTIIADTVKEEAEKWVASAETRSQAQEEDGDGDN